MNGTDRGLFVSEVLKGFTTGILDGIKMYQGKQERDRDYELKNRELDIREKGLLEDRVLKEAEIGRKTADMLNKENLSKMELMIKQQEVDRKVIADQLKAEFDKEKLGLENNANELKRQLGEKDQQLELMKIKYDADYKQKTIDIARDKNEIDKSNKEKELKFKEDELKQKGQLEREKMRSAERIASMKKASGGQDETYKVLDTQRRQLNLNPVFKSMSGALATIPEIRRNITLARQGNETAQKQLGVQMAKFNREVGMLSESDVTRYIGPASLVRKIQNQFNVWTKGQMSEKDYKDLDQILTNGTGYLEKGRNKLLKEQAKFVSRNTGLSEEKVIYLWGFDSPKETAAKEEPKTKYTVGQMVMRNGKKYKVVEKNGVKGLTPAK